MYTVPYTSIAKAWRLGYHYLIDRLCFFPSPEPEFVIVKPNESIPRKSILGLLKRFTNSGSGLLRLIFLPPNGQNQTDKFEPLPLSD